MYPGRLEYGVNWKTILTIVGKKFEYNCGVFIENEPFEMYSPGSSPSLKLPLGPIQTPDSLYPFLLSTDISHVRLAENPKHRKLIERPLPNDIKLLTGITAGTTSGSELLPNSQLKPFALFKTYAKANFFIISS